MYQIEELGASQCRYPLTDPPEPNRHPFGGGKPSFPHFFCGEPTADPKHSYCPAHKALCSRGAGKHPRSLEEMIYALDNSVVRTSVRNGETRSVRESYRAQHLQREPDHTEPLDVALRGAA